MVIIKNLVTGFTCECDNEDVIRTLSNDKDYEIIKEAPKKKTTRKATK